MAFQPQQDVVPGDQYRYALQNFRIAHEKVEEQRRQLQQQERQVAELRAHVAVLEGQDSQPSRNTSSRQGGQSVDDFSIKNAATKLEKQVARWAQEIVQTPPASMLDVRNAAIADLGGSGDYEYVEATQMHVQNLLRHALSETISEGIINCLMITNSSEANVQLTRIHEHLFSRDPTVACVWRRQTFTAAVESFSPEMSDYILKEHIPALFDLLSTTDKTSPPPVIAILDSAYAFSRMLHGSRTGAGGKTDAFYRAFVPELDTGLDPRQMELVKRCLKSERGEVDRIGACIFPGIVKITGTPPPGAPQGSNQTVVKRAQVICDCAMGLGGPPPLPPNNGYANNGYISPPSSTDDSYYTPPPSSNGMHSPPPPPPPAFSQGNFNGSQMPPPPPHSYQGRYSGAPTV